MSEFTPGELKARQPGTWTAGDYALIGSRLVIVSELLCEAVDLRADHRVLDVATGHGNTALAAARRGCDVTGVDLAPALAASSSIPLAQPLPPRRRDFCQRRAHQRTKCRTAAPGRTRNRSARWTRSDPR